MRNIFTSTRFNPNLVHLCLFILRLGVGIMMLYHGLPKVLNFTDMAPEFFDPLQFSSPAMLSLVVFAEVICSILLILGLLTRWAVIPLIIEMLVILLMVHVNQGFGKQELAAHYLVTYIVLWLLGPGRISVDNLISRK